MNYDAYQNGLVAIADDAERELVALAERRGELSDYELAIAVAAVLERAEARVAALADTAAAAALSDVTGTDVLPRGARRSRRHLWTVEVVLNKLKADGMGHYIETTRTRLYETGARTWSRTLQRAGPDVGVEHWTRRTEGNTKCPICTDLADGRALRLDTPMYRHAGCRCVQEPTTTPDFTDK